MGFLSRIVADARAHAPVVSATAPAVERTQAADTAEGWEVVEMAFSPEWAADAIIAVAGRATTIAAIAIGVERAATLPAAPPMAAAPRSAPHGAPARSRPDLPVAPSTKLTGAACDRPRSDDRTWRPVHTATAAAAHASQRRAGTLAQ